MSSPEITDELTLVDWDEITLGALASHLAGIKADFSADLSTFESGECTVEDFLQHFGDNWPVLAPFTTPVYSNNGAAILGLVSYSSLVALVPDYNLVFAVMATGPTSELPSLGPGLNLTQWIVRGKDLTAALLQPAVLVPAPAERPAAAAAAVGQSAAVPDQAREQGAGELERGVIGVGTAEQIAQANALLAWEEGERRGSAKVQKVKCLG
ncbi:uncharacterized protein PpBr36_10733 [Pyricularia pennisetigena]|uniref:uncharacterized protein n=1 Tax=Pyricularia pennisetigena TaxID=1578925 RepID=UPI0011521231|nr:uncharacterized protein PpBr36_10733 [Pyricularia pennisetigena]TLS20924.1 hypothetical protein PpBr36_10733 [Pyricularia pennisetigena]